MEPVYHTLNGPVDDHHSIGENDDDDDTPTPTELDSQQNHFNSGDSSSGYQSEHRLDPSQTPETDVEAESEFRHRNHRDHGTAKSKPPPSPSDYANGAQNDQLLWASPFDSYPVASMSRDAYGIDDDGDDGEGEDTDTRPKCGWGRFTPKCLQVFLNVRSYLVVFSLASLVQVMTAYGLVSITITSIEHRFKLTSFQSGAIMSAYQFATMVCTVFVTYVGESRHKPRWVGVGSLFLALGSILFTLPHFLSGPYQYEEYGDEYGVCPAVAGNASNTSMCALNGEAGEENPSDFFWIFIVAQICNSLAAAPLFTLGVTYMDDNLSSSNFNMYIGIYNALLSFGPAIGSFIGVITLSLYTDFYIDPSSITITPYNPQWVGAWWLGFLFSAALITVISFFITAFPKTLPGAKKKLRQRRDQSQKGSQFRARRGFRNGVLDVPRALCKLVCNVPFLGICGATAAEMFIGAGIFVFSPKFLESQFNISARDAGSYVGLLAMTTHFMGSITSGGIMKALDLKFRGLIRLAAIAVSLSILFGLSFIMHCPNTPIAGVSVNYINTSTSYTGMESELVADCNSHCACSDNYKPVCGEDGVMYFSPCHAGCTSEEYIAHNNGTLLYYDCRCIVLRSNSTSMYSDTATGNDDILTSYGGAVPGRCERECSLKWVYLVLLWFYMFFGTMIGIPLWVAVMRCVSHSQRAFALGVEAVFYGGLGSAPGPIVFGLLIDRVCLYWDTTGCGEGACLIYDNKHFAHSFLLIVLCFKAASLIFLVITHCFYKPSEYEDDSDDVYGTKRKRLPTTDL